MTTALYRRYRPDTFDQVIGQDHVTVPLRAALRANKVTHAYLFSGPRGCGKTTSARILARCLNCAEGPTDTPCGHCDSCRELATGGPGSLDVVEIDAASHGGVDDARDLRERATFAPVRDRYKIFIIDEAHMVTTQGFNAMLKLVEEPPPHVKFVFATTEPDRVIGTIRSRTHHYPFRLVPPDILEPYLQTLCDEERISVGAGVLPLVVRAGGGSVRDTLSVLDQLMAGSINGMLDYTQTIALLGYTDSTLLDQTVDALAGGDGAAVFRVVERMVESGHDPRRFVEDLLQRLRDLLIIAVAGDGAIDVLAGTPADQLERMQVQARNWGPRPLSRAADLTDLALRDMTGATSPRLQLELLLGRILVPSEPATGVAQLALGAAPVPGTVGMAGGGAPREAAPVASGAPSGGERFGAAQAKAAFQRRHQNGQGGEAGGTQASAVPTLTTPLSASEASRSSVASRTESSVPAPARSAPAPAAASSGWTETVAPIGGPTQAPQPEPTPAARNAESKAVQKESPQAPAEAVSGPKAPAVDDVRSADVPDTPPTSGSNAGRDADMLRERWPEVVERLSQISRVSWTLVDQNGQLGGVAGHVAVVLFPHAGLVSAFVGGHREPDVELAIHEVTGLTLSVQAQVGQAGGGTSVTTPGSEAARSEVRVDRAEQEARSTQAPSPTSSAQGGGRDSSASFRSGASTPAVTDRAASAPAPAVSASVTTSSVGPAPMRSGAPQVPTSTAEVGTGAGDGWGPVAVPGSAAPEMEETGTGPEVSTEPEKPVDLAEVASSTSPEASTTVAAMPVSIPEPSLTPQPDAHEPPTPDDPVPIAPVFEDEMPEPEDGDWPALEPEPGPEPELENMPSGWSEPVAVIPGGLNEPFFEGASEDAVPAASVHHRWEPGEPTESASTSDASDARSGGVLSFGDAPEQGTDPASGPEPVRASVAAAMDESASIDDDDVEVSTNVGLPAVLEILGGKVIEELADEEGDR